ncbi:glycosyltransferase family 39 protein [Ruminiclostridium josui]|uniref:glycosyltransferase family 39 protein n=1 Tax=Ruminiclostridium josui TaxID=1499 RepID=UPI000A791727|nr:glycosyltransferase family 39 protein [Ruminiclostridium josui]
MKKTRIKDIIFYIIVFGAIVLLTSVALIAAFKSGPSALKLPFFAGIIYFIGAGAGLLAIYKFNILIKINKAVFVTLLVLAVLIPRLIWNWYIQTQPFSDFLHLYNYGVNASQGDFKGFVDFYAVFPFKIGFGMTLAGLFSIFGSGLWTIKIFNMLLSLALVFIIYAGGKMLYGERAGRVASLLCALWPAQIMYTSVIASEHVFLVFFTGAVLLTLYFIKKYTYKNHEFWNGNIVLIGAGLVTALAQLIRPMAMIMLPVFAVFILLYKRYRLITLPV